jgi:signal transduction histidine kinase/ActR/RegA family two-component response regulator
MEVLATEMAANPRNMLQKLVETAIDLCQADTAGISILEGDAFRWEALAGVFVSSRGSTMARDASPCGVCVDQNTTQLVHLPDRCFPALLTEPRFVEALLIPFHDHGKPVGTVWIVANNFERKFDREDERVMRTLAQFASAGWQLWQACELAAESSRHKDEFVAMLAHELRNPLAAIIGAHDVARKISGNDADVLRSGLPQADLLQADLLQAVEIVGRQAHHLLRMVDDLIDLSRIGRGELEIHKEPVELRMIVDQAIEATHPQFEGRQHRLSVRIPDEPIRIDGDPGRLVQLLSNLLDNAAKYTLKGGEISIAAECADENVCIRVHDNGIGIPKDRIESIFDLYTQLNGGSAKAATRGLGLGLTLVRNLAELHGGVVEAASEGPGKGSEFTVRLPLIPRSSVNVAQKAIRQTSRRILLVEDNGDIAEALKIILARDGHAVGVAQDGAVALEMLRTFDPDIVFLDIGLPDMDGFELARRMRSETKRADLMIVALSGYGQEAHRRLSKEAGCDEHLVKPVHPDVLRTFLGRPGHLADGTSAGSRSAHVRPSAGTRLVTGSPRLDAPVGSNGRRQGAGPSSPGSAR